MARNDEEMARVTWAENLAYLLRFDSAYGRYVKPVAVHGENLVIAGREIRTMTERDPLPSTPLPRPNH